MKSVNKVALVLVAIGAVLALADAFMLAVTGSILWGMEGGPPVVERVSRLVFVAVNLGIIAVLVRNKAVIDAGHRARTVLRWIIIVSQAGVAVFGMVWALVGPDGGAIPPDAGGSIPWWITAMSLVGTVGLAASVVLGITMLVQGNRSLAAWLLAIAVVVEGVLFWGLTAVGSPWASPVYAGVVVNFGLALLGADLPRRIRLQGRQSVAG